MTNDEVVFLCHKGIITLTKRCVLREVSTEIRIESNNQATRELFLAFPMEFHNIATNNEGHKDKHIMQCSQDVSSSKNK